MIKKFVLPVPISLLVSILHVGCCIFPLISIAVGSASRFEGLTRYKPFFLGLQVLLLIYLSITLVRFYLGKHFFHSQFENWSYHVAFGIATAGLFIGLLEPFRTEQQMLAQKQFELFRTHRQIELSVSGKYNSEQLKEDITSINGVKPTSVQINGTYVRATFQSNQVSSDSILAALREQGYEVAITE
ncbi:heavy-metal-associated domain-containing protein [Dyadobacter sp. 32]|uniref:heavy-metal-associated domain-containing protein n=1 Tax=Dyadobacter sp. 32 TaxID=538966 RepID=UPI0011EDDC79